MSQGRAAGIKTMAGKKTTFSLMISKHFTKLRKPVQKGEVIGCKVRLPIRSALWISLSPDRERAPSVLDLGQYLPEFFLKMLLFFLQVLILNPLGDIRDVPGCDQLDA